MKRKKEDERKRKRDGDADGEAEGEYSPVPAQRACMRVCALALRFVAPCCVLERRLMCARLRVSACVNARA